MNPQEPTTAVALVKPARSVARTTFEFSETFARDLRMYAAQSSPRRSMREIVEQGARLVMDGFSPSAPLDAETAEILAIVEDMGRPRVLALLRAAQRAQPAA